MVQQSGVLPIACKTRRASRCPPCAEVYSADTYQLIRAGLSGGKGVPETVATHPCVFTTLTAPSFGPVHTRHVRRHSCRDKSRCACRPDPCHARRDKQDEQGLQNFTHRIERQGMGSASGG